jgi:Lipopolysaccharide kinase (Kdo/WaaP) family
VLPDPESDFPKFVSGKKVLYLRRDLGPHAPAILSRLGALESSAGNGRGNRRSGYLLQVGDGLEIFARRARRGGLIRFLLSDLYFGASPRPLRELAVAAEARKRAITTAEPLGAMVEWVAPAVYRGFFLTRAIAGMTLWDFMRTDDDPLVRRHVLEQARRAIDTMHEKGLLHADLNLHNLFVTQAGESFATVILDLDRAALFRSPISARNRRSNLARLARSARKLDPRGRYLDSRALEILTAG